MVRSRSHDRRLFEPMMVYWQPSPPYWMSGVAKVMNAACLQFTSFCGAKLSLMLHNARQFTLKITWEWVIKNNKLSLKYRPGWTTGQTETYSVNKFIMVEAESGDEMDLPRNFVMEIKGADRQIVCNGVYWPLGATGWITHDITMLQRNPTHVS